MINNARYEISEGNETCDGGFPRVVLEHNFQHTHYCIWNTKRFQWPFMSCLASYMVGVLLHTWYDILCTVVNVVISPSH